MLLAILLLLVGSGLVLILCDPKIVGIPAIVLAVTGIMLWGFSIGQVCVAVYDAATKKLEAEALAAMGFKPRPVPELTPVTKFNYTETPTATSYRKLFVSLPLPPEKLRTLATAYALDRYIPFSEPEWVDRRRVLSARQFRLLKDEALKRGWIEAKSTDPRQGYKLTRVGWAVLCRIADGTIKLEAQPLPHPSAKNGVQHG